MDGVALSREAAEVAQIDAAIRRLYGQCRGAADILDREFARAEIDRLLERRFELASVRVVRVAGEDPR